MMNARDALAGIVPKFAEEKRERLKAQIVRADALRELILHKRWAEMSRIMDKFHNEAVQELGTKGLEQRDWLRINHRMELLADIGREIQSVISGGNQATVALGKMKETSDGG